MPPVLWYTTSTAPGVSEPAGPAVLSPVVGDATGDGAAVGSGAAVGRGDAATVGAGEPAGAGAGETLAVVGADPHAASSNIKKNVIAREIGAKWASKLFQP